MIKTLMVLLVSLAPAFLTCGKTEPDISFEDRQWLLLPKDLPGVFSGYAPRPGTHKQLFFFTKIKTARSGFSAVYRQQLADATGTVANYTMQVSYSVGQEEAERAMRNLYTIEAKNQDFIRQADAAEYGVDDVLLLQSDSLLYLAQRKGSIVYFVQIEQVAADLLAVKQAIRIKILFIETHSEMFRGK